MKKFIICGVLILTVALILIAGVMIYNLTVNFYFPNPEILWSGYLNLVGIFVACYAKFCRKSA